MKKLYFILWVFLACFVVFPPVEVSGQSVVLIEKDTFQMYSNPLGADSTLSAKVSDRLYDSCYIRDLPVSVEWWRLQNDSLFLEKIEDCYSTVRSDDHKMVFMDLEGIFDDYVQDGKVFASWFSGELNVVGGECIHRGGMGFRSDYEDEWIYRVENGRVVSRSTYRNVWKETVFSVEYTLPLIETLFNGDRFPELANKYLLAKVQVISRPDGSIDSLGIAVRVVPDKSSISQVRDNDGKWIENDFSNSYIQELKECVLLVPAWNYVKLCGRVHPQPGSELRVWEGKGCKAVYRDSHWNFGMTDTLRMDGRAYKLENYPLQYDMNLYARIRSLLRDEFTPRCLRGYTACWEIRDGFLYLISLRGAESGKIISFDVIFPGSDGSPIKAIWYTGELHLSTGNNLDYANSSRGNASEEISYKVRKGKILK